MCAVSWRVTSTQLRSSLAIRDRVGVAVWRCRHALANRAQAGPTGNRNPSFVWFAQAEKAKVLAECASVQQWLADKVAAQSKLAKHADAVLLTADIIKKATELTNFGKPILSKPKPKPPPKEEKKDEEKKPDEPAPAKDDAPAPQPMDTEVD